MTRCWPAAPDVLDRVLVEHPPAFAVLHRPETKQGLLDVLIGEATNLATLADLPLAGHPTAAAVASPRTAPRHDVLAVIPYRQLSERGYSCVDDGAPLIALAITGQATMPIAAVLPRLPDLPIHLSGESFDLSDEAYAETVRRVVADEIGAGAGSNFVIKRCYRARIDSYAVPRALALFRRLLLLESGAYWTYIVHTGDRTLVGAAPERHISLRNGVAVMNPVSGTLRYPASGPTLGDVIAFLADRKEAEELWMVVDEELKMMARICESGGQVRGPYLKEMARLAHTEYLIEGRSRRDPRDILRETMFAPTVTGSPLANACRVISRYEPHGRGYYGGVVALLGRDEDGSHAIDSTIVLRTADIDAGGRLQVGVGATLVRHSDPGTEAAETRAKAAALIAALKAGERSGFGEHPEVKTALARRNAPLADFWLAGPDRRRRPVPVLAGRSVLVVDAEDTFTFMIEHQLRSVGMAVTVLPYHQPADLPSYDLVVMGPGPGDPQEAADPRMRRLRSVLAALLARRHPFLAVCLSHQLLSLALGLPIARRAVPDQGVQREIELFGVPERVGFYNTFTAISRVDQFECPGVGLVEVSRDQQTGEVHALRGSHFASLQFHAESVLTRDGVRVLGDLLSSLLRQSTTSRS